MDRKDIVKRLLYPKCKSALEFKFDTLITNPLLTYVTIQDINALHQIATSIKYSSKPKEKYEMINNILVPRGFVKMASGTNRVVYRFLNDYRIVLKVAIDKVGLSDNGNEYKNQHFLKPFVTKCFEVSPCGTVGLFERVVPITSREEFENIAEDVFDLINNLIGKYVLEDIGEKFYMNYGLREGFGPVLLDYPYMFELDGRKLICNVPEPLDPKGYCGGEIDYDIGYNNLICTKCGKRYLATELKTESENERPKIIIKGEDMIMKCVLKRGDEVVDLLNSQDMVKTSTIKPRKEISNLKVTVGVKPDESEEDYKPTIKTNDEVTIKVSLRNDKRNSNKKNIDEIARLKEEKALKNTECVKVSLVQSEQPKVEEKVMKVDLGTGSVDVETTQEIVGEFKPEPNKTFVVGNSLKNDEEVESDNIVETDKEEVIEETETDVEEQLTQNTVEEETNENYTTSKITSPIEDQYKLQKNPKEEVVEEESEVEEQSVPELIIHPREEESNDEVEESVDSVSVVGDETNEIDSYSESISVDIPENEEETEVESDDEYYEEDSDVEDDYDDSEDENYTDTESENPVDLY